jgi:hypothetical protein
MPGSGWFKIVQYILGWLKWSSDAWFRMVQDSSIHFRMAQVEFGCLVQDGSRYISTF